MLCVVLSHNVFYFYTPQTVFKVGMSAQGGDLFALLSRMVFKACICLFTQAFVSSKLKFSPDISGGLTLLANISLLGNNWSSY